MSTQERRHDLDALRAFAMFLGILFHAAGAYTVADGGFPIRDLQQHEFFDWLSGALHGFRMPLFFVISGFFSALLIQHRGLRAYLRHRALRILLPLGACLVVLIPVQFATWLLLGALAQMESLERAPVQSSLWAAAVQGDARALHAQIAAGARVNQRHQELGASPLSLAVTRGHPHAVDVLLATGADVNSRNQDGTASLHAAVVFGYVDIAERLLAAGADPHLRNAMQLTPRQLLDVGPAYGRAMAWVSGIDDPTARRMEVRARLEAHLLDAERRVAAEVQQPPITITLMGVLQFPFFLHLWFLWFLVLYALLAALLLAGNRAAHMPRLAGALLPDGKPWLAWLWLVPTTALPMWFMVGDLGLGPDGSLGLLPEGDVFALYGVFFGVGLLLYHAADAGRQMYRYWWQQLLLALCLVMPVTVVGNGAGPGIGMGGGSLWALLCALYAWLMIFGCMGWFAWMFSREREWVRYASDASYWIYLVHIAIIFVLAFPIRALEMPGIVKLMLVCTCTGVIGFASYALLVRHTFIGRTLNGSRTGEV